MAKTAIRLRRISPTDERGRIASVSAPTSPHAKPHRFSRTKIAPARCRPLAKFAMRSNFFGEMIHAPANCQLRPKSSSCVLEAQLEA